MPMSCSTEQEVLSEQKTNELIESAYHVLQKLLISMSTFHLCLPQVMVSINEARRDDFACTINASCIFWRCDVLTDLCDSVIHYEYVCT